ncbi:gibberellin-regulated protein 2-like isoform X2 [Syzygium oleosum]|uniref:gibberellin-regulated protein 2-like isoform X2 n=1 Tax=Syzygium oleosum TaxID=219896 RepID=UPI0011D1FEE1|nr:gibberellin-regulated protein 2-like isoform X2 [Syzygium oleosum]
MAFKAFVFLLLALLLFTAGSSTKAAAYAPGKPPGAVYPPEKAPIAQPPAKLDGCVAPCEELCKKARKKRPCMKACTTCCNNSKCVPLGSSKCPGWDFVYIHGVRTACP